MYEWIATYDDGKTFRQFGLDGKEYGTNKIPNRHRVRKFQLLADKSPIFSMDLKENDILIYRRRTIMRTLGGIGDPRDMGRVFNDILFIIGKRGEKEVYHYIKPVYHFIRNGEQLSEIKTHEIETRTTHDLTLMDCELCTPSQN